MKPNTLKKFRNSRGQAALEYMMTYGWAILIIALIGVVLWQLGVFNPPTPAPGCSGFSQVRPLDWKASSADNKMYLTLTNDAGVKIRLDQVNVTVSDVRCSKTGINKDMRAGEVYYMNVSSCTFPSSGNYYKADIIIVYRNLASDIDHNSVGECHGLVE